MSGWCHKRLSMADNSGDVSICRDVQWRVSTEVWVQADKRENRRIPMDKIRFMPAKIRKTQHRRKILF